MKRRLLKTLSSLVLVSLHPGSAVAQLDTSAFELGQAIADWTARENIQSLLVLPFAMSNGNCTALSHYVADALGIGIITHSAEALILADPTAIEASPSPALPSNERRSFRAHLDALVDVDGLVDGTLGLSDDELQIVARLVTARTEEPLEVVTRLSRDSLVDTLASQSVNEGPFCGGLAERPSTQANGPTDVPPDDSSEQRPLASQTVGDVTFEVWDIDIDDAGHSVVLRLTMRNDGSQPSRILGVVPRFLLSDQMRNMIGLEADHGLHDCVVEGDWETVSNDAARCATASDEWRSAPLLEPGVPHQVLLRGTVGGDGAEVESRLVGSRLFITGGVLVGSTEDAVFEVLRFSALPRPIGQP